jgi:hypothetical protein
MVCMLLKLSIKTPLHEKPILVMPERLNIRNILIIVLQGVREVHVICRQLNLTGWMVGDGIVGRVIWQLVSWSCEYNVYLGSV